MRRHRNCARGGGTFPAVQKCLHNLDNRHAQNSETDRAGVMTQRFGAPRTLNRPENCVTKGSLSYLRDVAEESAEGTSGNMFDLSLVVYVERYGQPMANGGTRKGLIVLAWHHLRAERSMRIADGCASGALVEKIHRVAVRGTFDYDMNSDAFSTEDFVRSP